MALHARLSGASVALQRATRVNAEICGIADEVGTLEVGKVADVAVFDGDVLAHPDLLMTTRPRLVLAGGAVVARTPRDHRDTEEAS
ncbi:MAG: amidohydrolase family protein [Quadrisphaera sp.]